MQSEMLVVSRAQAGHLGFWLVYSAAELFSPSCLFLKMHTCRENHGSLNCIRVQALVGEVGSRARQALAARGGGTPRSEQIPFL